MKQFLNNKTVTMQQDGWSSVQNDPITATSVVSDGKGYFVDAKDTDITHKTAEACKAMFEDSKSHAETTYGVRYGLLSQTMLRTWTRCTESWRRRRPRT